MADADPDALLHGGDPHAALAALQARVRQAPSDPRLRTFLFQLLALLGQWGRAGEQLRAAAELDAGALAMAAVYAPAVQAEPQREAVFAGQLAPHVFGRPAPWLAQLVEALRLDRDGHAAAAAAAREQALGDAPARAGTLDAQRFEWLADADTRLGPVLEVIVAGRYGWLPLDALEALRIEPAADLRDLVWVPAQLRLAGGGETPALIPTRYAGTTAAGANAALLLARRTEWVAPAEAPSARDAAAASGDTAPPSDPSDGAPTGWRGLGQRMLVTDAGEAGILDVRELAFDPPEPAA